ncbi:MAG: hypothetical protein C4293_14575 [Nitrospiraceae bacterium]
MGVSGWSRFIVTGSEKRKELARVVVGEWVNVKYRFRERAKGYIGAQKESFLDDARRVEINVQRR